MALASAVAAVDSTYRVASTAVLRASLATTTSYVATDHFRAFEGDLIIFNFDLTWVDSTSHQWYVEWSNDGTTWRREMNTSKAAGVLTFVVQSATYVLGASGSWIDGQELNVPRTALGTYGRLQVKKTGGVGADALAASVTIIANKHKNHG